MSAAQIDAIFRAEYFDPLHIYQVAAIPNLENAAPPLAEQLFDSGILHGIDNAGLWLQEALQEELGIDLTSVDRQTGVRKLDGIIGPKTRQALALAVQNGKAPQVNNRIADKRIVYMRSRPNFPSNSGWIPRAESFRIPVSPGTAP